MARVKPEQLLIPNCEREIPKTEPLVKPAREPIWSENKAKLIERYLYYFVLITKHGTYIDGFTGPQWPDRPEMWSAKLVLECEPRWLRHFHLFELDPDRISKIQELKQAQPKRQKGETKREIFFYEGDFNERIHELLAAGSISQKEATFCLLDQHSTQCHWKSLQALAGYKQQGCHKIELFYFLGVKWLSRTIAATTSDLERNDRWWGGRGWESLVGNLSHEQWARKFEKRFKTELGYESAKAWPIYERSDGGTVMYYMIHGTDHPEGPGLMRRAYNRAVQPKETMTQVEMFRNHATQPKAG